VPLDHQLKNGDIVEIITSKIDNPSIDWLNFVKTSAARTKIKSFLKKQKREQNLERGKAYLNEELKKMMLDPAQVLTDEALSPVLQELNLGTLEDLIVEIGYGEISPFVAAKKIRSVWEKHHGVTPVEEELIRPMLSSKKKKKRHLGVQVVGASNVLIRFSKCCKPIPGEEIIGYITRGKGVTVHRLDCINVKQAETSKTSVKQGRFVKVEWNPDADQVYPVEIEVEAFDRVGVLHDILEKIAETKTNVSAANVKTKRGSSAIINMIVDIRDFAHLGLVTKAIRSISDVYNVLRKNF